MVDRLFSARRVALLGVLACLAAVGIVLVGSSTLFAATAAHPRGAMSVAQPGQAAGGTAPNQVNYLWSIPSASGSLTGRNNHHLVLRLGGVRDYLTRFTDRPVRQAFVVANVDFVRRFRRYFADANPNAVLSFTRPGHRIPTDIVLQIGQPRWNPKTATLTFPAARILKREDNLPDTTVHIKPPLIPNPRHFDQASLLIDSGSASPVCSQSGSTGTCTYLFAGINPDRSFLVPAGVTSVQVVVVGANGGSGVGRGGYGAEVAGTLAVTPGYGLTVIVGGNGGNSGGPSCDSAGQCVYNSNGAPGGYDGGGPGGNGSEGQAGGAGGGGISQIYAPFPQRHIVAAGGGGAPGFSPQTRASGGDAGQPGSGANIGTVGGGAGTQTAGGAGGVGEAAAGYGSGSPGTYIVGGRGSDGASSTYCLQGLCQGGGGGGGGLYGGGGGSDGAGGGGGSSLLLPGLSLQPNYILTPEVQISWQVPTG